MWKTRKEKRVFRIFLLAVLLTGLFGSIGYMLVPAVGPDLAFPSLFAHHLDGHFYRPLTELVDAARAPRDVFPSLHVAVSTLVLWFGARRGRTWFLALLPLVLGNWFSTLYLRYHYLVDVIAGWAVAALSVWLAGLLVASEERWRASGVLEARRPGSG